ncbi:BUD13-like protein [Aphelenchoides fujianensis]|nr:BUD13-like protein [Aphelenchoides fujianensis]
MMSAKMSAKALKDDYLKKYLTGPETKKPKKKKKNAGNGLSIEADSAFAMVAPGAYRARFDSDEESDEEARAAAAAAKKRAGFKSTFEEVEDVVVVSPPRDESPSPPPARPRAADQSPPRRRQRHDSGDADRSPPRLRARHDSPSPPAKSRKREHESPLRRRRHDSNTSDQSPPRSRRRHDSRGSDQSPPRRKARASRSPRAARRPVDDDQSPPRRGGGRGGADRSPAPTKRPADADNSPPRRRRRHDSGGSDRTPPRRRRTEESPPRRPPPKEVKREPVDEEEAPAQTTGLLTREQMREKAKRDREEQERLLANVKDSGRGAEAVHRGGDLRKKRLTKEDEERNAREAKKQEEIDAKYSAISKGIAQEEERNRRIRDMEQTVQEGFTRHADDEAMNKHLREKLFGEDDPMNEFISAKHMKIKLKSEFVYPTYTGHWPPNRYNIQPGYRWDGVDRSNGFEGKLALRANRSIAEASAAYRTIAELAE